MFGLLGVLTRWSFHPLNQDGGSVDFDFESVEVSTYGPLLSGLVHHLVPTMGGRGTRFLRTRTDVDFLQTWRVLFRMEIGKR